MKDPGWSLPLEESGGGGTDLWKEHGSYQMEILGFGGGFTGT
jgi:hypothetical protein